MLAGLLLGALALTGCGSENNSISPPVTPTVPVDSGGTPLAEASPTPLLMVFDMPDSRALAYSPDGTQIAVGGGSTIWLYTADLQQVRALKGHTAPVHSVAWSPDGTQIASGALDNTVHVWDAATGTAVHTLTGHTNWVLSVAWSPDGSRIASGGADDMARLWDAASGDLVTVLGVTRVTSVMLQFQNQDILNAIDDLAYADAIIAKVEAEPHDLVQQILDQGYTITFTFDDQAFVDTLLKLDRDPPRLGIAVGDSALSDELAALDQQQMVSLITKLDDPDIAAVIDELNAAEATITTINERPDADLLRTIRQLQRQDFVIVIQQADGETTTVNPADANFVATIQDFEGQDVTLSVELQDQQAIFDALQNPDFVAALNQLEEASNAITTINERPDVTLIRLVRQLQPLDYTITFATGDEKFDAALAALDRREKFDLVLTLQDPALMAILTQLASVDYTISRLKDLSPAAVIQALHAAPAIQEPDTLDYAVAINVEDSALSAEIGALTLADLEHVVGLLENNIFRYQLSQYASAQATIATINARDDAALIAVVRSLGGPKSTSVIFSSPQGSDEVKVNRKLLVEDYVITVTPTAEDTIEALSVLDDATIADQFRTMDAAQLNGGTYTLTPELDADALALIVPRLADMFAITVQRENNAQTGGVTAVTWSPDSTILASASSDNTVKLWNPSSGQILATLDAHKDSVTSAAWSPDAALFATGSWDNTVIVWDASGGPEDVKAAITIKGFEKRVNALAWSPDGAYLATGDRAGTIQVWDAATGDELAAVQHHPEVIALAWSPDGSRLISSGGDGTVRLWDVALLVGS